MGRPRGSKNKNLKQFCKRGHDTFKCGRDGDRFCNICSEEYQSTYWRENKDYLLDYAHKYYAINKENIKLKVKPQSEKSKIRKKKYIQDHIGFYRSYKIKSQTNRNLRIPLWTDKEIIKEVYKNCPPGMVVDHIIPLIGQKVSGLHVSWNLQYLSPENNSKKHITVDLNEISKQYGLMLEKDELK